MNEKNIPGIDLAGDAYRIRQNEVIEGLRSQCPYASNDTGYVFFNQKEINEIFANQDLKFSYFHISPEDSPYLAEKVQGMLLAKHGEDHRRLRVLTMQALSDHVVDRLRDDIRDIVNELIDHFPDRGEIDLIADFTDPLPARVLGPILGVPYDSVDGIDEWISVSARNIDAVHAGNELPEIEEAWRKLDDYLARLLEERRQNPGNDIFSELIKAEEEGDRLNRDELTGIASELARAGVETTRSQFAIIVHQLLKYPEQWAKLQREPGLAAYACEEGMRFAPLTHVIPQEATKDLECCGVELTEGKIAMVHVKAANYDPAQIDRPDEFDVTREPRKHYTFGSGAHICPGMRVARMEMVTGLEMLAHRISHWELIEEPEVGLPSQGYRPKSLRVRIEKLR